MTSAKKVTGRKRKSSVKNHLCHDSRQNRQKQTLIKRALAGETDYSTTNDTLESRDIWDVR